MHSAHCAAVSVVPYTLQAKMSISGRRGQGKSEAGGSLTHCALKRFITPSVLKFKKGVTGSCFNKRGTDGHITSKDEHKWKERPRQVRGGRVTDPLCIKEVHNSISFEVQKRGYLKSCCNTS